jgi:GNAT superfamily N-acetyltransferase
MAAAVADPAAHPARATRAAATPATAAGDIIADSLRCGLRSTIPFMGPIHYRLAAVADVDALVRLRIAFLAEVGQAIGDTPHLESTLRDYFSTHLTSGDFVSFLAESECNVVATSGMVFHVHPPSVKNPNGRGAHIMNMYTLPAFRGGGIATNLLQKLIDIARERECRRVFLYALPLGKSIYVKAGFVPVEPEMQLNLV